MDILHRSAIHIIYIGFIASEILERRSYDEEGVMLIGLLACLGGCVAIEFFFAKNKENIRSFVNRPSWETVRKIFIGH